MALIVRLHENSHTTDARKILIYEKLDSEKILRALNRDGLDYCQLKPWKPGDFAKPSQTAQMRDPHGIGFGFLRFVRFLFGSVGLVPAGTSWYPAGTQLVPSWQAIVSGQILVSGQTRQANAQTP